MLKVQVTIGVLLVLILLGHNYVANIPQAVQDSIMEIHSASTTQFNLLYSLETFPSMFLIIPLGILFDILGAKLLIPGTLLLMLGQLVLLVYTPLHSSFSFIMMIIGRIMQGISGQMLYMAMGVMTNKWMGNLSGLIIVLPEIGEILNVFFTPLLNIYGGLYLVNFCGMIVCFISFLSTIYLWRIDKKYEKMTKEEDTQIETVECSTYTKFPKIFWVLISICAIDEAIFIPFLYNANTMLQSRFGISYHVSGGYVSVPFLMTILATGLFAILLRKVTRNKLVLFAGVGGLVSHLLLYLIPNSSESTTVNSILIVLGFTVFGMAKGSFYSIIYPTVGQVIPKRHRGAAYALVSLVQSLGITIIPQVSAIIIQNGDTKQMGYTNSSLLFIVMALFGMILTFYLINLRAPILSTTSTDADEAYYQQQAEQSMTSRENSTVIQSKQEIV